MRDTKLITLKLFTSLFSGFFLCALGFVMILYADLGADPWTTFEKSISNITGLSFGRVDQVIGLIIVLTGLFFKITPGIGTILNMYFIGFFINMIENSNILFIPSMLWVRILFLLIGMVLGSIGTWLYLKNGLGAGPRDGLMLGLMRSFNMSVSIIKTSIEVTVLAIGLFLGGPIGIGTLITAFGNGTLFDQTFQIAKFDSKNTYQRTLKDELDNIKYIQEKRNLQRK